MIFSLRDDIWAQKLWAYIKGWKEKAKSGKPWMVEVLPENSKRTRAQEKRHWARMRWLSNNYQDAGKFADQDWHAYFCGEFIGKREIYGGGYRYLSSTDLSPGEYVDFETKIDAWLAGMGVWIPDFGTLYDEEAA